MSFFSDRQPGRPGLALFLNAATLRSTPSATSC